MAEAVLNLIRDVAEGRPVRLFVQGDLSSVTVQGFLSKGADRPMALEAIGSVRSQWIRKLQRCRSVTVVEIKDTTVKSTPITESNRKRKNA
jgi:hypothetical protein